MTHPSAAGITALYDAMAPRWAGMRGRRLIERHWLARFRRALPGRTPEVLDLGCGNGVPVAAHLAALGCRVTGVDGAEGMIRQARACAPGGRWITADMRDLPPLGRFDGIIAWHSFFHLPVADQVAMFRAFRRHARPGAVVMFTSGTERGEAIGQMGGRALYHASLATREYRRLLAAEGFRVLRYVAEDARCGGATVWLARWGGGQCRPGSSPAVDHGAGLKPGLRRRERRGHLPDGVKAMTVRGEPGARGSGEGVGRA